MALDVPLLAAVDAAIYEAFNLPPINYLDP